MQKLNVLSIDDNDANPNFRYGGTYAHGELEKDIMYDIFAFDRETRFVVGMNDVYILNTKRQATFFLWISETVSSSHKDIWRGYLVYNDDEDYAFCKSNFDKRTQLI